MYILDKITSKFTRISVVFLLSFMVFGLFMLNTKAYTSNKNTEKKLKELNIAVSSAPISLDSRYATDASSIRVLRLLSAGLVKLDKDFKHQPDVAESYTHENFKKYIFKLKSIAFSDGEKLTSTHVKSFYESIMKKGSGSPLYGLFADVEAIKTPTPNTIEFYLNKPNIWFLTGLETPIFKLNLTDSNSKRIENPIGLFINKNIKFIKKTNTGDIWLKNGKSIFKLQVIKDPTVRVLKLMNGEIDIIYNDLPSELYSFTKSKGYKNIRKPSASYTYIGFNLENSITSKKQVREAISYAINTPYIVKYLLNGNATFAQSLLLNSHPAVYKAKNTSYNPKKAIEILEQAGYTANKNGTRLTLDMSVTTNPFVLRIAQIIQQQLKNIGVEMNISSSEWGSFYGNIKKGNFESYILTWVGRFQPDIFYSLFHSSMKPPYGANRGRYNNYKMDNLLNEIKNGTTIEDVYKKAIEVQKLQEKEKIYLPLWRRSHGVVMAKNITGCEIPTDGGYEGLLECVKKTVSK